MGAWMLDFPLFRRHFGDSLIFAGYKIQDTRYKIQVFI